MDINTFVKQELDVLIKLEPNKFGELLKHTEEELKLLIDKFNTFEIHDTIRPRIIETYIGVLQRLLNRSLIAPLTGEEDEWEEVVIEGDDNPIYRNKRLPTVLKTKGGACFFEEAIVFFDIVDKFPFRGTINGVSSTLGIKSFPFIPQTFMVEVFLQPYNVEKNGERPDMVNKDGKVFVYTIKDKKPIAQANKYYNK